MKTPITITPPKIRYEIKTAKNIRSMMATSLPGYEQKRFPASKFQKIGFKKFWRV
jgi:hypothetical protein